MQLPIEDKLDRFWSFIVMHIWGDCALRGHGKCIGPHSPHHVIGRADKIMRWDVKNGVRLCQRHHTGSGKTAHGNGEWFKHTFLKENHPQIYSYLFETTKMPVRINMDFFESKLRELKGIWGI
jgi:hypothetical protein